MPSFLIGKPQFLRDAMQAPIAAPQARARHRRSGKQVNIDVSDATSHQATALDEVQHLVVRRDGNSMQTSEQVEHRLARLEVTARELADDEGVDDQLTGFENRDNPLVAAAKVVDPY